MSSLSAHLRQAGGHGHLPFHPGCPVCRTERLVGTPPGDELLSARSRAGLAAALMAATSVPVAPAMAGEVDAEQEGAALENAPAPLGDADPGFYPGAGDAELPADAGVQLSPAEGRGRASPGARDHTSAERFRRPPERARPGARGPCPCPATSDPGPVRSSDA